MNKNELEINTEPSFKSLSKIKEKGVGVQNNIDICFIYGDKNDFQNEDIFFKEMNKNDFNFLNKIKSSVDSNLQEKNLHKFFNEDLIKALDDNFELPDEKSEISDSSSSNQYVSGSSGSTSNTNSPKFNNKLLNKGEKSILDMNFNLNYENSINKININNANVNLNNNKGKHIINDYTINKNVNKINFNFEINNLFEKSNNSLELLENEKEKFKILENFSKKKEMINNLLKNKFDDDVEQLIALPIPNKEEKTKMPIEIRKGDWICLYCNNLNYSFRIKCNRCGLLKKSSIHLLNLQKYYNNKF